MPAGPRGWPLSRLPVYIFPAMKGELIARNRPADRAARGLSGWHPTQRRGLPATVVVLAWSAGAAALAMAVGGSSSASALT